MFIFEKKSLEKILHFDGEAIQNMEQRFRANFINSVTGYKSSNLIGTITDDGITNLAVFSSVIHIGSQPPLLGFITRPTTVPRHTYINCKTTKVFTINHIHSTIIKQAHHTAARYDAEISEFEKSNLTEEYLRSFPAPFVKESFIKIACSLVNEYPIKENGTVLMVGAITDIYLPNNIHSDDGWIDLSKVQSTTINGLDSYSKPYLLDRLSYPKPEKEVVSILKNKGQ